MEARLKDMPLNVDRREKSAEIRDFTRLCVKTSETFLFRMKPNLDESGPVFLSLMKELEPQCLDFLETL